VQHAAKTFDLVGATGDNTRALGWPRTSREVPVLPYLLPTHAAYLRHMSDGQGGDSTWTDEYRDVIDFFYWEPQHLGRIKNPISEVTSAEAAWSRVAGLEVATNHILNFYFAMVPLDTINANESWAPQDDYRLVGSQELEDMQRSFGGFTQADLLLRGTAHDCAIELKTKSKATVAQVRHYATMQALTFPDKPLTLVLLTPYAHVSEAFKEMPPDVGAVRAALVSTPPSARVAALVTPAAYAQVLARLDVRLLTYEHLYASVEAAMLVEVSLVGRRVHQGLLSWLRARGLA